MGRYVDGNLRLNESVVFHGQLNLWSLLPLSLLGLATLPLMGLGYQFLLMVMIRYFTTDVAVTSNRILGISGFFRKKHIDISVLQVEYVHIQQSYLGRLFDYGTLTFHTSGKPQPPIKGIAEPMVFRKAFMRTKQQKLG